MIKHHILRVIHVSRLLVLRVSLEKNRGEQVSSSRNYHLQRGVRFQSVCRMERRTNIITVSLASSGMQSGRQNVNEKDRRFTVGVQSWRWLVDYKVYSPRLCFHFVTVHSLIMLLVVGTTKTLFPRGQEGKRKKKDKWHETRRIGMPGIRLLSGKLCALKKHHAG